MVGNRELDQMKCRVFKVNNCNEAEEVVGHGIVDSCRDESLDGSGIKNSCGFEDNEELDEEARGIIDGINNIIDENISTKFVGFKKIERSVLKDKVNKVNRALTNIRTENLSGTHNLMKACYIYVGEAVGLNIFT